LPIPASASTSSPRRSPLSGGTFEEADLDEKLAEIDASIQASGFWEDPEKSKPVLQRRRQLERRQQALRRLTNDSEELQTWNELLAESEDGGDDAATFADRVQHELEQLELQLKLSGEHDDKAALMLVHSGAGGTDSQDWADMLLRMYLRWAEKDGYEVELLDRQDGEEAGIKSATLAVRGDYAYGYLKGEMGVHRLVRISPFDANARRQTSFASIDVYPEIDDEIDIEIDDKDLRIDTFRSSGAGGQHVNKTESAIRITHLPTGIVVSCQNERSQHKNRSTAMKVLKARLYDLEMKKREEENAKREGEKKDIAWGSQIRSYVLHPYRMVKDHRTGVEVGDADRVLDGDLAPFIEGYLRGEMDKGVRDLAV
jgi:peptide chain release factor 2